MRIRAGCANILENALAACADPVVIQFTATSARLADLPAVSISVRDNGPGLSDDQRQRIFDPFYTTKTKETGLGMAIAKRIIEAHGGRIAVGPVHASPKTSGVGGAEIVITLPREAP